MGSEPPKALRIPGKGNGKCEQAMLRGGKELMWAKVTGSMRLRERISRRVVERGGQGGTDFDQTV